MMMYLYNTDFSSLNLTFPILVLKIFQANSSFNFWIGCIAPSLKNAFISSPKRLIKGSYHLVPNFGQWEMIYHKLFCHQAHLFLHLLPLAVDNFILGLAIKGMSHMEPVFFLLCVYNETRLTDQKYNRYVIVMKWYEKYLVP